MTQITLTTEQLVNDLHHNQAVEMEVIDHEGGHWTLGYKAAEPDSDEPDTIEFSGPGIHDEEVEADAFLSLHAHYTWTVDAIR